METKIPIEDVSAQGGSILETGTEDPRLEGELHSKENNFTSNEDPFKYELRRSRHLQSDGEHM